MAWIMSRPRIEQVYVYTVAALNDCGIMPDGAVIKPWIREELDQIHPVPTKVECEVVLVGLVTEGAKLIGDKSSRAKFEAHPLFKGSTLGEISEAHRK
jgi:hypothetical protein